MSENKNSLKLRIKSVKSTQKITKAMKMVATAKFKKTTNLLEAANLYANKINNIVKNIISENNIENLSISFIDKQKEFKTHLLIVTSSERGLCGSFNSSIIKMTKKLIAELKSNDKTIKILCVGKKSYEQLKNQFSENIIDVLTDNFKKQMTYSDAERIADKVLDYFYKGEFDSCSIVYNKFKSVIKQETTNFQLIPLDYAIDKIEEDQFEYEPAPKIILEDILPKNLIAQIFYVMLDNLASEHASRMNAMDNATNSASDMIKNLSLIYNRTRQAAITKELIEIISGAEAV